jgi:hypothetical protein
VPVEVDPTNPDLIFAMAKLAVSAARETKVASDLLHIFDNSHTFELTPLHPKLPSANKILIETLFPARA